jgi:flagellar hook-basal body complex protein FliE
MAIKNIGNVEQAFKKLEFEDWTKRVDAKTLTIGDAPSGLSQTDHSNQPFSKFLADSISKVNTLQEQANTAVERLASGKSKNIHETLMAVEQADIAFKTMNQIRSKVLDAYKEIMRMQV